jgi:methyl-accepting chemotaxis protein
MRRDMKTFSSLKIGTRLWVGFALVLSLVIGLSAISIQKVQQINQNLATVNDVNSKAQRYAINFRGSVHDRAIALRDVTLVEPAAIGAEEALIKKLTDKYAQSAAPLDEMMARPDATEAERAIVDSIKQTEAETLPLIQDVIQRQRAGDATGAHQVLMDKARPLFVQWLKQINQFIDLKEAENKEIGARTRAIAESFTWLTVLLSAGALVLGGVVALWSVRSVRPLGDLTRVMNRLAANDFSATVPSADRKDEIGTTCRAAPNSRPPAWKRPPPPWTRSPPPCARPPTAPAAPPPRSPRPAPTPSARARWSARPSRPWAPSRTPRARSPRSSA